MDYIRKLPLLMALSGAIIIGLVGYSKDVPNKENMLKMVIVMVIFYIVGLFIRNTITGILQDIDKKTEEKEKKELEEKKRLEELEDQKNKEKNKKNQKIDFIVDDDLDIGTNIEDFEALPVADFIKNELNQ
jgi:hypothetical protein